MKIIVERQIPDARKMELGIAHWPTWEKEVSSFPWTYGASETCLLVAGEVTVTPKGGEAVTICAGDLATFPAGMRCTWAITQDLCKHYSFG